MAKSRYKKIPSNITTASVTQLNHEGRGVTHVNGKATFLFGALPGETVQFKYTRCHRQYDEGIVTAVTTASKDRVTPRCPHFGVCGGCSMQHVKPEAQRAHKQSVLLEHFFHQAQCQPEIILEPLFDHAWEYRRRARLSVRYVEKKNSVLIGFRERATNYVAHIQTCDVLHPSVGKKIKVFSELLMQLEMKAHIPQLEIAIGDDATVVILRHLVALPSSDIKKLTDFAAENAWQLYCQPHGLSSIHSVFPKNPTPLFYDIPSQHITMQFLPTHFTQINQTINLKMIERAIALLDLQKTDCTLDLFCGIGNFSLPIAKHCAHVVGVEGSSDAISQAKINAKNNHIKNTEFYTHDLTLDLSRVSWAQKRYDKILLDPPRMGAKALLPCFNIWKPLRIVYISCNPITLARDTKDLLQLGYRLAKAGVMDMFPHTDHIEAIALFVRDDNDKSNHTLRRTLDPTA